MILFLDFDGVLHPVGCAQWEANDGLLEVRGEGLFRALPALEALLREYPQVEVVILSTWRRLYSLEELRAFFSFDMRSRIVGVAPLEAYSRIELIQRYLGLLSPSPRWLVLDDDKEEFPPDCPQLVLVDGSHGLLPQDLEELRSRLQTPD